MAQFGDCPFGFEDGHIVSYEAELNRLLVRYEFWNEKHGVFAFDGFLTAHDNGALGIVIGSTKQEATSDLLTSVVRRHYENPPVLVNLTHYAFLDLDDFPVFEVVAEACCFWEPTASQP